MKNTLCWEKISKIWFPFILTAVVDRTERYCAEDRTAAGILPWKRLLEGKREQAGASTAGGGTGGVGGWEFDYKVISTIGLFKWYAEVCVSVCVCWIAWRKIHNHLIVIMSGLELWVILISFLIFFLGFFQECDL